MTGVKGSYCIPRIFEVCLDGSDRYLQIDTYRDRPIYIYMYIYIYIYVFIYLYTSHRAAPRQEFHLSKVPFEAAPPFPRSLDPMQMANSNNKYICTLSIIPVDRHVHCFFVVTSVFDCQSTAIWDKTATRAVPTEPKQL